ncbi:MAG: hypothetical protein M9962_09795 [Oligoflexia bacterium]|nr:hypothetical protein [Oligoflexia bacterium]
MKKLIYCACTLFLIFSCSSQKKASYKTENNRPKFSSARSFLEPPSQIINAAHAVLDELTQDSDPPVPGNLRKESNEVESGWIYGTSEDKYLVYDFNGKPRRKPLGVRRQITFHAVPSLSGSQVTIKLKEEVEDLDKTTGERIGWKNVTADAATYDILFKKLSEKIRER